MKLKKNVRDAKLKRDENRPTAVVLTSMGGPETLDDIHHFLYNLFSDKDMMELSFQEQLVSFIATRRTPRLYRDHRQKDGARTH
jgi:ferrochelatase